ncbi:MAG: methyltransferase domain-containing protein [Bacteroidota bacterium]
MEDPIRWVVSLPFRGSKYHCPLCQTNLNRFVLLQDGHALCPRCGSLPRTRRLWFLIDRYLADVGDSRKRIDILHFSPPKALRGRIKQQIRQANHQISYQTSDVAGEFSADLHIDLTNNKLADQSFNLIICYHILEHIDDDKTAMTELFRLLKPGGLAIIQTPFHSQFGDALELPHVITAADRLKHYGQEDHVRVYTVSTLQERLQAAGFSIVIKQAPEDFFDDAQRAQLKAEEFVIEAWKK